MKWQAAEGLWEELRSVGERIEIHMASRLTSVGDPGVVKGYEYKKGLEQESRVSRFVLVVRDPGRSAIARRVSQPVTRAWTDLLYPSFSGKRLFVAFIMVHALV